MAQKGKQNRGGMLTTFTGISPLTIHDVNGHTGSPLTISDPFPWTVTGTVGFTTPATGIAAMAYQINDGPVNGFAPPTFGFCPKPPPSSKDVHLRRRFQEPCARRPISIVIN